MTGDPFALGGTDPLIALGAEWDELLARIDCVPEAEADGVSLLAVDCEDRIAALVPTSAAGAAVQFRLLRQFARDCDWNEHFDRLAANVLAVLDRLAEGGKA